MDCKACTFSNIGIDIAIDYSAFSVNGAFPMIIWLYASFSTVCVLRSYHICLLVNVIWTCVTFIVLSVPNNSVCCPNYSRLSVFTLKTEPCILAVVCGCELSSMMYHWWGWADCHPYTEGVARLSCHLFVSGPHILRLNVCALVVNVLLKRLVFLILYRI